jgi:hypothetical protein
VQVDPKQLKPIPHAAHGFIPVAAAGFHNALLNATALTTVAGAANRLDFMPFIPALGFTCNELAVEVTTLLAASLAHVGIYDDLNGVPNNRLAFSASALDCATTGVKTAAISQALVAGRIYWLAVLTSSTQTLRAIPLAGLLPLAAPTSGTAISVLRRATFTFAALPATAPATVLTSAVAPWVRMKVA